MARCLNLTRAGEYAIAALARLALKSDVSGRGATSVRTLAREQEIPKSFLSKILARYAKAGIVQSKKGPDGGVALARPPQEISLLAVIEACEGSYGREFCVFYPTRRCDGPGCEVYCPLREREERVRSELDRVTLAEMARALRTHPRAKDGGAGVRGGEGAGGLVLARPKFLAAREAFAQQQRRSSRLRSRRRLDWGGNPWR